jgi:hypothetical protein
MASTLTRSMRLDHARSRLGDSCASLRTRLLVVSLSGLAGFLSLGHLEDRAANSLKEKDPRSAWIVHGNRESLLLRVPLLWRYICRPRVHSRAAEAVISPMGDCEDNHG